MKAALLMVALAGSPAALLDRVVAIVDDHAITARALDARAARRLELAETAEDRTRFLRETLDEMIDEHLVALECTRLKIEVTEAEIDAAYANIKEQTKLSDVDLAAEIEKQGMTAASYRALLRDQLRRLRFVNQKIDRSKAPKEPDALPAWMEQQAKALTAALRAKAYIEVKL